MQQGKFNMVDIYLESLIPKVDAYWRRISKQPKHKETKTIDISKVHKEIAKLKTQREVISGKEEQIKKVVKLLMDKGFTLEQIKEEFIKRKYPEEVIIPVLKQFKKNPLEELRIYIQKALTEGFSKEDIKKELVKSGWPENQINILLKQLEEKKEV